MLYLYKVELIEWMNEGKKPNDNDPWVVLIRYPSDTYMECHIRQIVDTVIILPFPITHPQHSSASPSPAAAAEKSTEYFFCIHNDFQQIYRNRTDGV